MNRLKDLSDDLEAKELQGRSVTLKIKTDGFQVKTRVKNLHDCTADAAVIGSAARVLLRQFMEEMRPLRLRLMGVRVSGYMRVHVSLPSFRVISCLSLTHSYKYRSIEFYDEHSLTLQMSEFGCEQARRQKTLDSFLQSRSSTKEGEKATEKKKKRKGGGSVFECPICGGAVEVSSELAFNAHLDRCLREQERQEHRGGGEHEQGEQSKQDEQQNCGQIQTNVEPSERDVDKSVDNSDDNASPSSNHVVCPVCDERIAAAGSDGDMLVNSHVDECLSRELLKSEERRGRTDIDRDRDNRPPPSKRAKSSNSIENYLTKGLGSR